MKVNLLIDNNNLEVIYSDDSGSIDHIKNLDTGKYVKIFMYIEGVGYKALEVASFLGAKEIVHDARYVNLPEYGNISIPYRIFIRPDKPVLKSSPPENKNRY